MHEPSLFVSGIAHVHKRLRAGAYIRKSNETEGRSKSREQQLEHCRQVSARFGFDLDEQHIYYEDEGQKGDWFWDDGTNRFPGPYRPELSRLMSDVEAGVIDVVIVWRSDRLYRDNGVCDAIMKVFRRKGVRFIAGYRDMDITSAAGLYQANTEAATNRRWRDQISEDVRRDHQFKAEMGMFSRNPSCLGFRSKGRGSQAIDPIWDELDLVLRVFTLFVTGEDIVTGATPGPLGTNGIANYLMDQGTLWPKGTKGHNAKRPGTIFESQVRSVLNNCMYIGLWRHAENEYPCNLLLVPERDMAGNVVPGGRRVTAVPLSLYEAAHEKLARMDRPGRRSLASVHLLTGVVVCARCGRPLHVHFTRYKKGDLTRPPRANFICPHARGTRPCPKGSILRLQEPVLDAWVIDELAPLLAAEIQEMRTSAARDADRQALMAIERELKEARDRETKKLAFLIDTMDAEQIAGVANHLRAEREARERRANEIRQRLDTAERAFPDISEITLYQMPKSALKEALTRALQWIAVGKTGITVLTSWGAYIGANYRERDRSRTDEQPRVVYLAPPDPAASLICLERLSDPAEFIRGRRDSLGAKADRLTDEELLPGWSPSEGNVFVSEADISHLAELYEDGKERAA